MSSFPVPPHPGLFVRQNIIPKEKSVTDAAELMGVGRQALSNFLNGKAALSPAMAAKLEHTFGAVAADLLAMQSAHDVAKSESAGAAVGAKRLVPPFLSAKANDIESWAGHHSSRSRLAVFLRTLIHSTVRGLGKVDFPGNDDSERPGWDGYIESAAGNPWVPSGVSGWEFGVNKVPAAKADKDYAKSIKAVPKSDRANITFVFVTPCRWPGKMKWQQERRAEGEWKGVLAYDSSDLEQWLEQSIPSQVWFAGEQGKPFRGTRSLDQCWTNWNADCDPSFNCSIFDEAMLTVGKRMLERLRKDPDYRFKIAADSRDEAFAFLSCLFGSDEEFTRGLRDRAIVFEEVGPLSELAATSSDFIPIIADRSVEKEFSQLGTKMGGIFIYPPSVIRADADFVLDTLSYSAFRSALESMGLNKDRIDKLNHESGRSLTVLRRRLSHSHAIQHPDWSEDSEFANVLAPALLAGAWNASNDVDRYVLQHLAGVDAYESLEKDFARLLRLDHTPVWSVGNFRGVVSKIDAFYAVPAALTSAMLDRFYEVAELVLSEADPALDLPERDRWAAGMHGKTRDVSAALREGICETLVLLAVHGKSLLGIDGQARADQLVRTLLGHADTRTFESQARDLPLYAEASPETFLHILEGDLRKPEPQLLGLMRPSDDPMFSTSPRVGLLWALEGLAWSPVYFSRTVDILAALAEAKVDDNLSNKPDHTLKSIFRAWMPQTGAPLEQRISVLERLARQYPSVAWPLCVDQFDRHSSVGHYNHKPRWRDYAFGFGEPTNAERAPFIIRAIEIALDWPTHTARTLADLIENLAGLRPEDQDKAWNLIDAWGETASNEDRAWLREKIRIHTMTRRAQLRKSPPYDEERARASYDKLESRDPVQKHAWLFREHWVEESVADLDADVDPNTERERVEKQRITALKSIYAHAGVKGLVDIALSGNAGYIVGTLVGPLFTAHADKFSFLNLILERNAITTSFASRSLLAGLFSSLSTEEAFALLRQLGNGRPLDEMAHLMTLLRFKSETWNGLKEFGIKYEDRYWEIISADWCAEASDVDYAVRRLLLANRPRAAFALVRFHLKTLEPALLFRILEELPNSSESGMIDNMEAYHLKEALVALGQSKAFTVEQMAGLEFVYLDLYRYERGGLPNIERQIEENSALFVEAISVIYKRRDGSHEVEATDEVRTKMAERAYHLLETLSRIPGHDKNGVLTADRLSAWVDDVRKRCAAIDRVAVGDLEIGELLARAPADEEGVWPCLPVRDVLDQVLTDEMQRGVTTSLYNARGVHGRGEGGQQERDLAAQYEGWARNMAYTHPRVAATLRRMAETYLHEADWQDNEAGIRKRLRY